MRRVWLIGFSTMALAATLFAQARVGSSPAASPAGDARVGAGGIRTSNPNILYPGSPSGGQPGSILTPGTPRSPGAFALPATPGAATQVKPTPQGRPGRGGRMYGSRGYYVPVYGYGYGGVHVDSGSGPTPVATEADAETSSSANVVTVPPKEPREIHSRVFNVSSDDDGKVTTSSLDQLPELDRPRPSAEYWLIALKGGLIYAAASYEERDETFRFHTLEDKQFVVPLAEVDIAFTERLNSDLGREFKLR